MPFFAKNGSIWALVRALHVRSAGSWLPVKRAFVRVSGQWKPFYQAAVVVTLSASVSPIIKNYFSAAVWGDPLIQKVVEAPAGIEIGANYLGHALATSDSASGQAGSWAGELIINIRGVISGIGGAINSGVGGNALLITFRGRNGELAEVNNYGTMRAGGGGGGRAGNGGAGRENYNYREPESGFLYLPAISGGNWPNQYGWWVSPERRDSEGSPVARRFTRFHWNWTQFDTNIVGDPTSYSTGGWTYLRGTLGRSTNTNEWWSIARQQTRQRDTSGGIAGDAGRGQGFDGAATAGANAVAGGTNAGASGKSGNGGGWGQPGQAGANGANGNVGNGTAGAAPGLAGFYLNGAANCNFNNFGTALGRVA